MMKTLWTCLMLLAMTFVAQAESPAVIMAHLTGQNYGKVDTNIFVTAEEQKVFHIHSDGQGVGTWYDAVIFVRDGSVTIVERDSVSGPYKSGSKVNTTENVYRLPVDKIDKEEVQLSHGNRIVFTKAIKVAQPPAGGDGKPAPQP